MHTGNRHSCRTGSRNWDNTIVSSHRFDHSTCPKNVDDVFRQMSFARLGSTIELYVKPSFFAIDRESQAGCFHRSIFVVDL